MHKSVLTKELIQLLNIQPEGIYVDLTLGAGGHSLEILKNLNSGTLISFDVDTKSTKDFVKELDKQNKKNIVHLINDNFNTLNSHLSQLKIEKVDGVIADLGWSSDQLDHIEGLSYESPEQLLDMRFNDKLGVMASDLLNALGKKELEKMFQKYSDLYGKENIKLVLEITKTRKIKLYATVEDLTNTIDKVYRFNNQDKFKRNEKYKIYSKVFQALRISVNDELNILKEMLKQGYVSLKPDGNLLIITFHSGEEKIVNNEFQNLEKSGKAILTTFNKGELSIRPSVEELRENIRSRSAKLYGLKKVKSI